MKPDRIVLGYRLGRLKAIAFPNGNWTGLGSLLMEAIPQIPKPKVVVTT